MTSLISPSTRGSASGALERAEAARAWAHGWAISRHTPAPIQHDGYLQIAVGKPEQTVRYVLPHLNRDLLQRLVSTQASPGTWLKVCAPVETVSPLLASAWHIHDAEFLMSTALSGGRAEAIEGYDVQVEQVGSLVIAKLVSDTGELAASGQAALEGSFATFDQIITAPAHRRKGLGRCVMNALSQGCLDRGATRGVLVATEAGAALYDALGWSLVSAMTAASLPSVSPEHGPMHRGA